MSDKRNHNGVSFLIHHASPKQFRYEEDVLEGMEDSIGHYRISSYLVQKIRQLYASIL